MIRSTKPVKYTLVRHSAWLTGHAEFAKAVEERPLLEREVARVSKAGGLIFDDYAAARDRAMTENYPPEVEGLIPAAPGKFSRLKLGEQAIYLPKVAT